MCVTGLYGELAAVGHRVPRVDGEIEQSGFELPRIYFRVPQAGSEHGLGLDRLTQGSAQKTVRSGNQLIDVQHSWIENLSTREREQPIGQFGAAAASVKRRFDPLLAPIRLVQRPVQQLQVARDDRQQIVEVMRHPAGELADRVHLLRM